MRRAAQAAYWALPPIFCLSVYWLGLKAWFHQDDFAWLNLHLHIHSWRDLLEALFAPKAQGTIRPLSERAFFLGFYALFGLNALPFRLMVFATQFANLALAASIARSLTGSRAAGFLAAVFWTANSVLAVPLSWTSAYNQVLCAFFLLLSFRLLLWHIETGKRRYLIWQWVTFLLGFGVLEINVVYPALAAAYTLCCARRHFSKTLWMFLPSAAYAAIHWRVAPKPTGGLYVMHFDASVFPTLWTYWQMALGPARLAQVGIETPAWLPVAGSAILTLALAGFAAWKLWKRQWLAGFLAFWFLALLAPFLPLRDHISDYYLTTPVAGLAWLGAWAFICAWKSGWARRAVAMVAVAAYLAASVPAARAVTRWRYERGIAVRNLVRGLARAGELHPGKAILLTGVSTDLFWAGVVDKPYRLLGLSEVYLAPGSEDSIEAHPELGEISEYVLPPAVALRVLEENQAVVYAAGGERLKNVTVLYRAIAKSRWSRTEEPRHVDAGNPLFATQLGPAWHRIEGGYRWMPRRASVRLGGPRSPEEKLYLSGFCPARQVKAGPLQMTVRVNGHTFAPVLITRGDAAFELAFPLPRSLVGSERVEVVVEVDRTYRQPGDGRELGLVFGRFAIR